MQMWHSSFICQDIFIRLAYGIQKKSPGTHHPAVVSLMSLREVLPSAAFSLSAQLQDRAEGIPP